MRDKAEVVIVGAGIMGLSIAYNLAKTHALWGLPPVLGKGLFQALGPRDG